MGLVMTAGGRKRDRAPGAIARPTGAAASLPEHSEGASDTPREVS